MKPSSVGILGGSFNPVHLGHYRLAEEIQKRCQFNPLWIVPSKNPPHKPAYEIDDRHRLDMVKLAFESLPNTKISAFELESEGPSYAIRTIEHFTRLHPGAHIFFILGADAFYDLPHWYAFPDVMEACNYVVVSRAGWDDDDGSDEESKLGQRLSKLSKAGLLIEEEAGEPFSRAFRMRSGTRLYVFDARLPEISSTEVRVRLQLGESVAGMVPEAVERYLKTSRLYGTKKS